MRSEDKNSYSVMMILKREGATEGKPCVSVVGAVPALQDGGLLHTLVLRGNPYPALGLLHHGLSIQQAKAVQVAHLHTNTHLTHKKGAAASKRHRTLLGLCRRLLVPSIASH